MGVKKCNNHTLVLDATILRSILAYLTFDEKEREGKKLFILAISQNSTSVEAVVNCSESCSEPV